MSDATRRREQNRARRIRVKLRRRQPVTDFERAWLKRYIEAVKVRWHPKARPTLAPQRVIDEVCRRYGIARTILLANRRGGLGAEMARAVAILTLHEAGGSMEVIGKVMRRSTPGVHRIIHRATTDDRWVFMAREVAQVTQACRVWKRGDRVTLTVTVTVGDPVWCELDRQAEAEERSAGAIAHRTRREVLAAVE